MGNFLESANDANVTVFLSISGVCFVKNFACYAHEWLCHITPQIVYIPPHTHRKAKSTLLCSYPIPDEREWGASLILPNPIKHGVQNLCSVLHVILIGICSLASSVFDKGALWCFLVFKSLCFASPNEISNCTSSFSRKFACELRGTWSSHASLRECVVFCLVDS